jgi:hypothetical protein
MIIVNNTIEHAVYCDIYHMLPVSGAQLEIQRETRTSTNRTTVFSTDHVTYDAVMEFMSYELTQ